MLRIFAGPVSSLPDGTPTGIFKRECMGSVWVGAAGLAGDAQADRRVHGGPDKALHQYPVAHYARLAAAFPQAAPLLVPGSMGENLSVPGWDETNVRIGDIFRFGGARIQVSMPRKPCWKIDRRFGAEGMAMKNFIAEEGLTGWYFRVLMEGEVAPGCAFELLERPAPP